MTDRPNERQYKQCYEAGQAARRAGRPISSCPMYGSTEGSGIRREAWMNGYLAADTTAKEQAKARKRA